MTTELEMKQALDGWFYTMDYERGRVIAEAVRPDFTPSHIPAASEFDEDRPHFNKKCFTEEQDATILAMRDEDKTWREIGLAVRHDANLTRARYIVICRARGIAPKMDVRKRRFTEEQRRQLVALRADGRMFKEIAALMGLGVQQAVDLHREVRKHGFKEAA